MRKIIITTMLTGLTSFSSLAITIDINDFEQTSFKPCSTKFIDYELKTDSYSFLKYENNNILEIINFEGVQTRPSENYNVRVFGELNSYKNEKEQYYFIKTVDLETKEVKWINTDVLTGNPFLKESDILKKMENKICGIKEEQKKEISTGK